MNLGEIIRPSAQKHSQFTTQREWYKRRTDYTINSAHTVRLLYWLHAHTDPERRHKMYFCIYKQIRMNESVRLLFTALTATFALYSPTSTSTNGQGERREKDKKKKARVAHKFQIRRKYSYNIICFFVRLSPATFVVCHLSVNDMALAILCAILPSRNNKFGRRMHWLPEHRIHVQCMSISWRNSAMYSRFRVAHGRMVADISSNSTLKMLVDCMHFVSHLASHFESNFPSARTQISFVWRAKLRLKCRFIDVFSTVAGDFYNYKLIFKCNYHRSGQSDNNSLFRAGLEFEDADLPHQQCNAMRCHAVH